MFGERKREREERSKGLPIEISLEKKESSLDFLKKKEERKKGK